MHETFSGGPGADTAGADTVGTGTGDPARPTRPATPLVRLGAPVVGDLEPSTPSTPHLASIAPDEQSALEPTADQAISDTSVLRRAALLRLVGLGRSRAMR